MLKAVRFSRFASSTLLLLTMTFAFSGMSSSVRGGEVKLASEPTLSPDGSRLIFVWQDDLWTVMTKGDVLAG